MSPIPPNATTVDAVFASQHWTEEQIRWFYIMMGRIITQQNLDQWNVVPLLLGVAASGKSTLISFVRQQCANNELAAFYPDQRHFSGPPPRLAIIGANEMPEGLAPEHVIVFPFTRSFDARTPLVLTDDGRFRIRAAQMYYDAVTTGQTPPTTWN